MLFLLLLLGYTGSKWFTCKSHYDYQQETCYISDLLEWEKCKSLRKDKFILTNNF